MKKQNNTKPSTPTAVIAAATLLGLLFMLNAVQAQQPLKTMNAVAALAFLLTAGVIIHETEGGKDGRA